MHAFLSPSKKSWVNYDDDKLFEAYSTHRAAALGTRKHALANELILLGQKLPDTTQTLNMYVNDCISLFMHPEVPLAYSENAFGTADAINYVEEHSLLRIFDYKSGFTAVTDTQLDIYGALFCLEYKKRPGELAFDFRIYQNDSVIEYQTGGALSWD